MPLITRKNANNGVGIPSNISATMSASNSVRNSIGAIRHGKMLNLTNVQTITITYTATCSFSNTSNSYWDSIFVELGVASSASGNFTHTTSRTVVNVGSKNSSYTKSETITYDVSAYTGLWYVGGLIRNINTNRAYWSTGFSSNLTITNISFA